MDFTKLQSTGNDFVLVEAAGLNMDWPKVAAAICHRHYGVGGDGLLLLLPSDTADFTMRTFNGDGSEAEACGNGLRCLVQYIFSCGLLDSEAETVSVATAAGVRQARLHKQGDELVGIESGMGVPKFKAGEIPVAVVTGRGKKAKETGFLSDYPLVINGQRLSLSFVSMGNPHTIYFRQKPVAGFPLSLIGPTVENHKLFPNRVNFEVANVVSRKLIEVRVWERGVGETLACGSGACAVAVAARMLGYVDDKVDIKLPGGTLGVEWPGSGEVRLSGRAEVVFTGEWPQALT